jgi:hypothetical protein
MGNIPSDTTAFIQEQIGSDGFDQFIRDVQQLPAKLSGNGKNSLASNMDYTSLSASDSVREGISKNISEQQYKYLLSLPTLYKDLYSVIEQNLKKYKSTLDAVDFNSDDSTFIANIENVGHSLGLTPDQVREYYEKRLNEYKNSLHRLEGVDATKKQEILNLIDTRIMRLKLKGGLSSINPPITFREVNETFGATSPSSSYVQPVYTDMSEGSKVSAAGYSSSYYASGNSHHRSSKLRKSYY